MDLYLCFYLMIKGIMNYILKKNYSHLMILKIKQENNLIKNF